MDGRKARQLWQQLGNLWSDGEPMAEKAGAHEPEEASKAAFATTMIVLDELSHITARPILMQDLQQYFRTVIDRRAVPLTTLYFDSSALFTQLHALARNGYVVRTRTGYELTETGHEEAHKMRDALPPELTEEFSNAARALA